jgi:hypothetical protein
MKRRQKKKGLMYTYLPQMHWLFFRRMFFATPLQHRFCSIDSTLPLQHRLLQQHFNTAFAASLQHCLCNIIFYCTPSALERRQG